MNWAVLGTGRIANEMAIALTKNNRNFYSVASRTYSKGVDFAKTYGIEKVYVDYMEVFVDPKVDAIYLATTHDNHYQYAKMAIANHKHLLIEKAITLNSSELNELKKMADENNVIIMEAMTIFHMPLYRELRNVFNSGKLGNINAITMNFGSYKPYEATNRFFSPELAGGALLDIGVYSLSFIRWFFSSDIEVISSYCNLTPTGVDDASVTILKDKENQLASMNLTFRSKQPKRGMITCDIGYVEVMEYPRSCEAKIHYLDGNVEVINAGDKEDALFYEILDIEKAINGDSSDLFFDFTKNIMDVMTALRKMWGVSYPSEKK